MTLKEAIELVDRLSPEERRQLVLHLIKSLPLEDEQPPAQHERRSLLEFRGVGAHLRDQDAQEYVNELRSEWDHRP